MNKGNLGYTALGFSKSGFSCCGNHYICQLGQLDCAIVKQDPEAKYYCHCYQRNHDSKLVTEPIRIFETVTKKEGSETECEFAITNSGQLCMF